MELGTSHAESRLFALSPEPAAVMDERGRFVHVNAACEAALGWQQDALVGRRWADLVHPDDRSAMAEAAAALATPGASVTGFVVRFRGADGGFRSISWSARSDERAELTYCVARDVTEQHRTTERLREDERRFRALADASPVLMWMTDEDGHCLFVNRWFRRFSGRRLEEELGTGWLDGVHADDVAAVLDALRSEDEGPRTYTLDYRRRHANGEYRWLLDTGVPRFGPDGQFLGYVGSSVDITERKQLEARLRHQADHDTLTGLFNRRRFEQELERQIELARRHGLTGAVVMLDVDRFKSINDTLGHAEGDRLLATVSAALRERSRTSDVLARLGGDEFALVLSQVDAAQAVAVSHDLLGRIRAAPTRLPVTASIGVAPFGGEGSLAAEDLMGAADVALYEAKEAGRDRVVASVGGPGSRRSIARIRAAIDEGRLALVAQPVFDLVTGEVVQEELLVRLLEPDGTTVEPIEFLPAAERVGLIGEIDRWVAATGIEVARTGRRVEINVSARSIGDPALLALILERLAATGAPPDNVIFEVTENVAVANMERVAEFAQGLTRAGCGFALDGFGTGFGSFTYLRHLPVTLLKIDRDFVRGLAGSGADRRIIASIVGVARGHGMATVAEGVEDEACLEALRHSGVELAQGFHLGRPAPVHVV